MATKQKKGGGQQAADKDGLFVKYGVWQSVFYVIGDSGERERVRRSTGISAVGRPGSREVERSRIAARRIAAQIAEREQGRINERRRRVAAGLPTEEEEAGAKRAGLKEAVEALIRKKSLAQRSEATIQIVVEKAVHLIEYFGENRPIHGITATDIAEYAAESVELRKRSTVHKEIRVLREAIRVYRGDDTPPPPDLGQVYVPRERFLEPEEIRAFLAELPQHIRPYFVFFFFTGARVGEVFRVKHEDVLLDAGPKGEVRLTASKGAEKHRHRYIPLRPEVRRVLVELMDVVEVGQPLFRRLTPRTMRYWTAKACTTAALEPFSPNDMRRTFATLLARAGVPILHLKDLMGHSTTRMLERVYARVARGAHMHSAVDALPDLNMDMDVDDRGGARGEKEAWARYRPDPYDKGGKE